MKIHLLKCWPEFYARLENGQKPFELRKNDRDFQTGDVLVVAEYIPSEDKLTGKNLRFSITYVLKGPWGGLAEGWAILGIKKEQSNDDRN